MKKYEETLSEKRTTGSWTVYVLAGVVCILFFAISLYAEYIFCAKGWFTDFRDCLENIHGEILLGQVSLTFITISVMSVLSENNNTVYWENIVKRRLVSPKYYCFSAMTIYAFFAMYFSVLAFLLGSKIGVMVFFVLGTVVLTVLTAIMISVYYRKEATKEKLLKYFLGDNIDSKERRRCLDLMQAYTLVAYDNNDYDRLMENCYFYGRYTDITELRFLFEKILSNQEVTAYECNVLETILNALVENFEERIQVLESEKLINNDTDEIKELADIYKKVSPLSNRYIMSYLRKYLYAQEDGKEADTYAELEIAVLMVNYITKLWNCLFKKMFNGESLNFIEFSLDSNESEMGLYTLMDLVEGYPDITNYAKANNDKLTKNNEDVVSQYIRICVKMLAVFVYDEQKKKSGNDSLFIEEFGVFLYMMLFQLGFLKKKYVGGMLNHMIFLITKGDNGISKFEKIVMLLEKREERSRDMKKEEVFYGMNLGFEISKLECIWDENRYDLSEEEREMVTAEIEHVKSIVISMLQKENFKPGGNTYREFSEPIRLYLGANNRNVYEMLYLGEGLQLMTLAARMTKLDNRLDLLKKALDAFCHTSKDIIPDPEDLYDEIQKEQPASVDAAVDFVYKYILKNQVGSTGTGGDDISGLFFSESFLND